MRTVVIPGGNTEPPVVLVPPVPSVVVVFSPEVAFEVSAPPVPGVVVPLAVEPPVALGLPVVVLLLVLLGPAPSLVVLADAPPVPDPVADPVVVAFADVVALVEAESAPVVLLPLPFFEQARLPMHAIPRTSVRPACCGSLSKTAWFLSILT